MTNENRRTATTTRGKVLMYISHRPQRGAERPQFAAQCDRVGRYRTRGGGLVNGANSLRFACLHAWYVLVIRFISTDSRVSSAF